MSYNKLMDALNRIDELACYSAEDNDNGEAEQLEKDYNLVADFIRDHAKKPKPKTKSRAKCDKCGLPKKMYWCNECESSQDHNGECDNCGHRDGVKYIVTLDREYHDNCGDRLGLCYCGYPCIYGTDYCERHQIP